MLTVYAVNAALSEAMTFWKFWRDTVSAGHCSHLQRPVMANVIPIWCRIHRFPFSSSPIICKEQRMESRAHVSKGIMILLSSHGSGPRCTTKAHGSVGIGGRHKECYTRYIHLFFFNEKPLLWMCLPFRLGFDSPTSNPAYASRRHSPVLNAQSFWGTFTCCVTLNSPGKNGATALTRTCLKIFALQCN